MVVHTPQTKGEVDYVLKLNKLIEAGYTSGGTLANFLEQRAIKTGSNIFIVDKFCKNCTCKIGDSKIMKHVYL